MPARFPTDVMPVTSSKKWKAAISRAQNLHAAGATFHRTIRTDVWWVDPVPKDPPPKRPATYWVNRHGDGCYSCVCATFRAGNPCSHIARVCLETGATPKIWTDNPSCTGGHNVVVSGNIEEELRLPPSAGGHAMPFSSQPDHPPTMSQPRRQNFVVRASAALMRRWPAS